ncbi:hypothetical protein [Streptomyces hokutonensis]|uniref:hypothetical protein n=1 Tax=Streptomyces hokutonensis TaxID=1306990 RepID=UPI000475992B|nr:hypothetical protein [Streptomyces hokutonensis]
MNSVPNYLLNEDRQEYERILDEALRSQRPELAAVGKRLNPEQLRTMALNATALITAAAATEYQHYVQVREELRRPASSTLSPVGATGSMAPDTEATRLATPQGEAAEGAGGIVVAAVLAPVLAGAAAAIFLLVGYILKMLTPEPAFAQTMLTVGWALGATTAAALLVAAVALLHTALHNKPSPGGDPHSRSSGEVARAREAWHDALLERGILPFLRDAVTVSGTASLRSTTPSAPTSGRPHLGYARPGFSSPDDGPEPGHRPSFTSPDYTNPDFGGPEHQPE